jgi:hypothetical protein
MIFVVICLNFGIELGGCTSRLQLPLRDERCTPSIGTGRNSVGVRESLSPCQMKRCGIVVECYFETQHWLVTKMPDVTCENDFKMI